MGSKKLPPKANAPPARATLGGEAPPLASNPFAKLGALREQLPAGPAAPAPAGPPAVGPSEPPRGPARAVVRLERKGHGGKEVTAVEKLELAPEALERWARELKQALGCGGSAERDRIVFQGDQRDRLEELLARRGVRKVTRG